MIRILAALSLAAGTVAATTAGTSAPLHPAAPVLMSVYKSPTCGCCAAWIEKMKVAGFQVRVIDMADDALQAEKARRGVGSNLASCHTAIVNGYVVEGHVPAEDVKRMLAEKPAIAGIAAPGMPAGSPGMEVPGGAKDKYDVLTFTRAGKTTVFARH